MINVPEHQQFDIETQLQLDRLWDSWSQADKAAANAGYWNEAANGRSDTAWATYQNALKVAYRTMASAEADNLVTVIRQGLRAQFCGQQAYRCLSDSLSQQVSAELAGEL